MRGLFSFLSNMTIVLFCIVIFMKLFEAVNLSVPGGAIAPNRPLDDVLGPLYDTLPGVVGGLIPFVLIIWALSSMLRVILTPFSRRSSARDIEERIETAQKLFHPKGQSAVSLNKEKVIGWELAEQGELESMRPEKLQEKVDARNVLSADIAELKVRLQDPVLAKGSTNQRVIQKRAALEEALEQARIAGVSHRAGLDDDGDAALLERVRRNIREVLK